MPDTTALTMPNPGVDPSGKPRPALSATQDLPKVIAPEQTPEPTPEPQPEPSKSEPVKETKPDETPPWMKAEITKQRNLRRQAEQRERELQARIDTLAKSVEQLSAKREPEPKTEPESPRPLRPRRDQFNTPEAYEAALDNHDQALTEWVAKQASTSASEKTKRQLEAERAEGERRTIQQRNEEIAKSLREQWNTKREKAIEKYADYEEIAESDDVTISEPMATTLMLMENGADIAYALGKKPEEAARIARLPPILQAAELGRLSVSLQEKPQVSKAPPPIRPVSQKGAAVERGDEELSTEEYAAKHMARINPARARLIAQMNGTNR